MLLPMILTFVKGANCGVKCLVACPAEVKLYLQSLVYLHQLLPIVRYLDLSILQ